MRNEEQIFNKSLTEFAYYHFTNPKSFTFPMAHCLLYHIFKDGGYTVEEVEEKLEEEINQLRELQEKYDEVDKNEIQK